MYFFGHTVNNFIEWLNLRTGLKSWLDVHEKDAWLGFFFTMGTMVLWMVMMLFYFSLFKYFFLIVGSPVFAYLSEKTEAILNGKDFPFSLAVLTQDIFRGVRIALRNASWQTVYLLALLFACVVPVAGLITPIIALFIECYYFGFSMLDYSMERNKKSTTESIDFIGNHKGLSIGNGIVFYSVHWVPIIGWVLAPSYAVIAATLSMHRLKEEINETV